ncbi:MAG: TRAP transporter large permease [Anaerotruncus sp.]|nr:TRAP transporter large permease [Anaerotruncus sp.]
MESFGLLALVLSFFVLMMIGMPIAYNILASSFIYLVVNGFPLIIMAQRLYEGVGSFSFLAIPFFVMTGQFMLRGGLLNDLVDFVNAFFGKAKGAIAVVTIGTCLLMGSIVGLAVATAASLGTFLIPMMKDEKYSPAFSAAVMSSASLLGPIMPPSVLMITYCIAAGKTSIAGLFMAAIIPAILIALGQILTAVIIAKKRNYPSYPPVPLEQKLRATKKALPALLLPIIILGGIFGGIFSVTEASAVSAIYSGFLAFFVNKSAKLSDIPEIFKEAALSSGLTLILVGSGTIMSWAIANERLIDHLIGPLSAMPVWLFLLCVNLLLLVVGCFMDDGASVIILGPIIAALAWNMGIEPLHIALVICINLVVGLATPPFGITLFITSPIAGVRLEDTVKEAIPFITVTIAVLLLVTFVPSICLFLPRLTGYA